METLGKLPARRKIAVLGDMLEIGSYAIAAHQKIGAAAAKVFDIVITVGPHGKIIAEAARAAGLARKNVLEFDDADAAGLALAGLVRKDDLILIKASRKIRLDKTVAAVKQI